MSEKFLANQDLTPMLGVGASLQWRSVTFSTGYSVIGCGWVWLNNILCCLVSCFKYLAKMHLLTCLRQFVLRIVTIGGP